MLPQHFDLAQLPRSAWKNGGGTTREIVCWPPGAGLNDFDWRVSVATIAASGPFSAFAGVQRSIMLLDGDGVHLRAHDGTLDHALVTRWQPFSFAGEQALDCTLLGGESSDFNVMVRRERVQAHVQVLQHASTLTLAPQGLLMALQGAWRLQCAGVSAHHCTPGQGLWWAEQGRAWQVQPQPQPQPQTADACLVSVSLQSQ